jgi:hypothetical protein
MTFHPASVKALLSRTALTADHLGEIEARLRSEHHLADELLAACSMPSVQRRSPQPGQGADCVAGVLVAGVLRANRHDGPPWFLASENASVSGCGGRR